MRRREFLVGAAGVALGPAFWERALHARARAVASSYGALRAPDANGLRLPRGFTSRLIARSNQPVPGTAYPWHIFPDGQATFPTADGGWVLVSNSESVAPSGAGSSAIRFRKNGKVASAYRILAGTNANCAGGGTPWGRWLSCEEHDFGHVWECDPQSTGQGVIRPALGTFNHEAVAVDTTTGALYMTEDRPDGGFYRFTPDVPGDLRSGRLEIAVDAPGGLAFEPVPDPGAVFTPTRQQVPGTRQFNGGEGIWYDGGTVYFSTKGDNHVWAYDTATGALGTIYEGGGPLRGVDNLTVNPAGEVFVCEDGDDMQICVIEPGGAVAPFLQLTGEAAAGLPDRGNELAGVIFDPSHTRMYFSAQRAYGFGAVYEVRGPFSGASAAPAAVPTTPAPAGAERERLRIHVPERVELASLRAKGLPVEVELADGETLLAALRSDELGRIPGQRGSTPRPHTVTLARARRRGRAMTVHLRIGPAGAQRLRGRRSTPARVTVVAQGPGGRARVATAAVRINR